MPPQAHFDLATLPGQVLADQDAIRRCNPQRFEMEQLDAIVHLDTEASIIVGYKDVRHDEFWVRGHMPGYPLMPGVLMCEAAAQLVQLFHHHPARDGRRFPRLRRPGERPLPQPGPSRRPARAGRQGHARAPPADHRSTCRASSATTMVFHADIIGVPLQRKAEA